VNRRTAIKLLAGGVPAVTGLRAATAAFEPNWESLKQYRVPEWFRDAKLGIWAHWGPQCVPETGDWYARNLYIEDSPQYLYHVKNYGHPSKVGYKDIVKLWKAEKFDPDTLIQRYKRAGARYFTAMGVHHDNYDCWNSKHHRWNAVKIGPNKDIVGMWKKAAVKHGLRFGVTEHLERSYSWFNVNKGADKKGPFAGVPYDGNDPKYQDFYFEPHDDNNSKYPLNPPEHWKQTWFNRIQDLLDSYQPDLLYTDGGMPFGDYGRRMAAHFYNGNMKHHGGKLEAVYAIKNVRDNLHGDYEEGTALLDLERGVVAGIRPDAWQTDTCIGDWFYKKGMKYKTTDVVVHLLMDIVSKNGNLLLNFPLRPDGTLDAEEEQVLEGLTKWIAANGEAIYGTRPWKVHGEGPTQSGGGQFSERKAAVYTPEDFRFTAKGQTIYATCMAQPQSSVTIKSLADAKVQSVRMVGGGALQFKQDASGLKIDVPERRPGEYTLAFRID
jgi:alpha-L-fucosidase